MPIDQASKTGGAAPSGPDFVAFGGEPSRLAKLAHPLIVIALLALSAAWLALMSGLPRIEGRTPMDGVKAEIAISRDSLGAPRVTAKNMDDAYFGMGWVHAQDRMWQMEAQRRIGAGRLAEAVGEAGLANDRFMRTLGLYRVAERNLAHLDQPTRQALEAYARGVNAWLRENRYRLPLEYAVLGLAPEPWTPADSLVWQKLMALQLAGNWQDDILRAQLGRIMDGKRVQELFPGYPAEAPVTLAGRGGRALLEAVPEAGRTMPASNIWILAGNRTESGKPLLANDPHLGFRAPILWHLSRLEAPGLSLTGAAAPGVPFHVIAHNGKIAWGFTATQADTIDLFVEKLAGPDSYKTPEGPRPFASRDEVIRVKGGPDVTLKVRETRHGPVISDLTAQGLAGPDEVVALAATLLDDKDTTAQALRRMNRAEDWAAFTAALKDFQAPVLNVGYADTAGNVGFYTAGRVPTRKSGNGSSPARGWTGEGDWTGWIPFAALPQAYNPKSGDLINANNKVAEDKPPHLITAHWGDGHRAQRVRDLLEAKKRLGFNDMRVIQGDIASLAAVELKDMLAGLAMKSPKSAEAARRLAEWDGVAEASKPEPLIFNAWADRLNRLLLADETKEMFGALQPPRASALLEILTRRRHWCDDVTTPEAEGCEEMMERALDQAVADLSAAWGPDMAKWSWGQAHPARFDNAILGKVPLLSRLANLSVPSGGDDYTVARGSWRSEANGTAFPHIHGAGLRAVFDLSDLANSRFVIATGESGHPLSRHYDDMLESWRANRLPWPVQGPVSTLFLEKGR